LKGDLKYKLGASKYERFIRSYRRDERGVIEQRLNLGVEEKRKIRDLLIGNYRLENRYYKYEFLFDNCPTKIRNIISSGRLFIKILMRKTEFYSTAMALSM